MEGRALRPYPPVVVDFGGGGIAPASFVNLTPIVVQWKRRDRRKQTISLPSDPDEAVETGTEFCVRHGPPGFQTTTVLGTDADTSGDFNLDFKGYSRVEFFARRDGYESTTFGFDTVAENGAGASVSGLLGSVTLSDTIEATVTIIVEGALPTVDVQFTEPVEIEAELPAAITLTAPEADVEVRVEFTENFIIAPTPPEAVVDISVEGAGDIGTVTLEVPSFVVEAGADKTAGTGIYALPAIVAGTILGYAEGEIVEPTTTMATPIWAGNSRVSSQLSMTTASVTRYFSPSGQHLPYADFAYTFYTSEGNWRKEVGADGTIDKFGVNIGANSRTTDTVFTLRVNGVDTTQTFTVGAGVTGWVRSTGDPVAVVAGDLLSVKIVTGSGTQSLVISASHMAFEATEGVVMHHYMQGDLAINIAPSTSAKGGPFNGTVEGNSFAISWDQSVGSNNGYDARVHTAGVVSRLSVFVPTNTSSVDQTMRLYKNGSATDLLVTIPAATTGVFSNNADEISVAPGDRLHYRMVATAGGGTGSSRLGWAQCIITRDVAAFDVYVAQRASDPLQGYNGADHYMGTGPLIYPTETDNQSASFSRQALPVGGAVDKMWVYYNHSGGGTLGYSYTMRKNGVNTALTCNAPSTTGAAMIEDNTNVVNFADGDRVSVVFRPESFSQWPQAWGYTVSAAA